MINFSLYYDFFLVFITIVSGFYYDFLVFISGFVIL